MSRSWILIPTVVLVLTVSACLEPVPLTGPECVVVILSDADVDGCPESVAVPDDYLATAPPEVLDFIAIVRSEAARVEAETWIDVASDAELGYIFRVNCVPIRNGQTVDEIVEAFASGFEDAGVPLPQEDRRLAEFFAIEAWPLC